MFHISVPIIHYSCNCAFRKLPSIYVFSYFPFGFEGRMWDLVVLSFYFTMVLYAASRTPVCLVLMFLLIKSSDLLAFELIVEI